MENSHRKQNDTKCEQCVNVGWGRPLHHKASMYSMCQDINLSSVPSVGHKTGSSFSTTDRTDLADSLVDTGCKTKTAKTPCDGCRMSLASH